MMDFTCIHIYKTLLIDHIRIKNQKNAKELIPKEFIQTQIDRNFNFSNNVHVDYNFFK